MKSPDLLLAILPPYGVDMPPLNLATLSSYLKERGIKVEVRDSNISIYRKVELDKWWDISSNPDWIKEGIFQEENIREAIEGELEFFLSHPAPVIGFSVHASNRSLTAWMIKRIKERDPSRKIIIGGRGVYDSLGRSHFSLDSVDVFIIGEGEEALYQTLLSLKEKEERIIPGVMWVREGEVYLLSPPLPLPVSKFPFTTFEEFPLSLYKERKLPLLMSRGCILHCAYCDDHRVMGRYRVKSGEAIFREMKYHLERWGIREFSFNDPAINGNLKELEKLCDLIIEEGIPVSWMALAIPRPDMGGLYEKMKKAGCHTLNFGVESGSDRVLKLMNKPYTSSQISESIRQAHKAGINTQLNFILGFPGEREEDVEATMNFIEENSPYISGITNLNACHLLINSPLWEERKKRGICLPPDFSFFDRRWREGDNTLFTRISRVKRVQQFLKEKNIPLWTTNTGEYLRSSSLCLIFLPPWGVEMPPLGLACLYSYLKSKGVNLKVEDLNICAYQEWREKIPHFWKREEEELWERSRFYSLEKKEIEEYLIERMKKLVEEGFTLYGFSTNYANLPLVRKVSSFLKKVDPEVKVLWGGPGVFLSEERRRFSSQEVDWIIAGEGEESLYQFLQGNRDYPGMGSKEEGFCLRGAPLPLNLEDFPPLDFSPFPLSFYASTTLPTFFSRGCKGRCTYCGEREFFSPFRTRRVEKVVEEIKFWVNKGYSNFQFMDQAVNSDSSRFREFLRKIKEEELRFYWEGNFMIKRGDIEVLPLMKECGVRRLFLGLETGSDKVLRMMRKTFSPKIAEEFLKEAYRAGIECWINLITGHPGEGEREFSQTRQFLKKNAHYISGVLNLSSCLVPPLSILEKERQKFSLYFPPYEHWFRWSTKDNTWKIREERLDKLREDIRELNLPLETINRIRKGVDILLINPPPWGVENPPLSLAYLSSYARKKGFTVEVLDLNLKFWQHAPFSYKLLWHVENKNFWKKKETYDLIEKVLEKDLEEACREIIRRNPSLVGFSVVDGKERITISLIKRLREMGAGFPIVLGGPAVYTPVSRKIFQEELGKEILGYVVGEGEETLVEIAGRVKEGRDMDGVKGVAVEKEGRWLYISRPYIKPLDSIPFPDYEGFEVGSYPGDELLVEWSRGCVGRCAFCKNPRLIKTYRYHNPPWVVEEIEHHGKKLGVKKFTVVDPLLNGYLPQLEGICDLLLVRRLQVHWSGQIAPRRDMSLKLLQKMREAGCYKLQIGVESGSSKVLKRMKKFYTPEDAEKVVREAKEAGMEVEIFLMVGFPGEGEEEFYQTYRFVERNAPYIDKIKSINTLHLIEDTDVYENHSYYGIYLPQTDWHYLWWTEDGNNYEVRKKRGEILLRLAWEKGIKVQEVNFGEGKEKEVKNLRELEEAINSLHPLSPPWERREVREEIQVKEREEELINLRERIRNLEEELNKLLQSRGWRFLKKVVRVKRAFFLSIKRFFLLPLLIFLIGLTMVAESYLLFLKKVKRLTVFPE